MHKKGWQINGVLSFLLFLGSEYAVAAYDPTKPLIPTPHMLEGSDVDLAKIEDLDLTSIFISKRKRLVIINGRMLKVGEKIEGFTIKEVKKDHVTLEKGEKTIELKLLDVVVRQKKE